MGFQKCISYSKHFHSYYQSFLAITPVQLASLNLSTLFFNIKLNFAILTLETQKIFLNKLRQISNLPKNTYLVTMDAESVYTNIDGEEGAETCRIKSENHENKNVQINFNCVDT